MATLGSAGPNQNFAPGFTVPPAFSLLGYVRDIDKPVGTFRYSSVRLRAVPNIALAKASAVETAIETFVGAEARLFRSGYGAGDGISRIDIVFGKRPVGSLSASAPPTGAQVTTVLGNAAAAIP